jgi:hypothetical protein
MNPAELVDKLIIIGRMALGTWVSAGDVYLSTARSGRENGMANLLVCQRRKEAVGPSWPLNSE